MSKKMSHLIALTVVAIGTCMTASTASAQAWPARPIRWIIPYAPGGTSDTITRILGEKLGERLGQPVIIENKAGAGGTIGTDLVAKSPPDGYTMVLGNIGPMAINRTLFRSLPYDPEQDFVPITLLMAYGSVVLANPSFEAKTLRQLIDLAKTRSISYAGNSVGTSQHLTGELLAKRAGVPLQHIPYKGGPPGLTDAMAGVVPLAIEPTSGSIPLVKSGKLRGLAVTTRERLPQLPDVPTVIEQGIPDFEVTGWIGVLVPKGTPEPIVGRLVKEFTTIMQLPEIQRKVVEDMGSFVPPLGPKHFEAFIRSETAKWREVIVAANIKPE